MANDNYSKIEKLEALKKQGQISEEEFQQRKAKILGYEPLNLKAQSRRGQNKGCARTIALLIIAVIVFYFAVLKCGADGEKPREETETTIGMLAAQP
ncbi:SHOCT domain-containing protein [Chryseobacterium sp. MFBS3-17]|uniref:SHOCT domain-containing protein n=1 Tax=Chryseobacterium sp. MFBS3-17 TaxID=2886689 RepID=UPI001D0EA37A|nr:SHOCT domain-containing protein [Chryseobacterium sp. MFBS3-17]MCC2591011.1 SHOCT domain-containing protein [Chryseobacterium sp. MFBS3-17]